MSDLPVLASQASSTPTTNSSCELVADDKDHADLFQPTVTDSSCGYASGSTQGRDLVSIASSLADGRNTPHRLGSSGAIGQFRTGTMLKLATPSDAASSSASKAGAAARARSSATTQNRQTGRLLSNVMRKLSFCTR